MTTEKRPTAAEAREQALAYLDHDPRKGNDGCVRAIERAQEAAVLEALEPQHGRYPNPSCSLCKRLKEAEARLDALAEEVKDGG